MCRWLSAEDDPEELLERKPHAGRRASTNGRTILVRVAGLPLQGALRPEGVHAHAHALVRLRGCARAPARSHLLTLSHCAALCLHMHAHACNSTHTHATTHMHTHTHVRNHAPACTRLHANAHADAPWRSMARKHMRVVSKVCAGVIGSCIMHDICCIMPTHAHARLMAAERLDAAAQRFERVSCGRWSKLGGLHGASARFAWCVNFGTMSDALKVRAVPPDHPPQSQRHIALQNAEALPNRSIRYDYGRAAATTTCLLAVHRARRPDVCSV